MRTQSSVFRPLAAAGALGLIAGGVAACGSSPNFGTGPGCETVKPGSTSDSVKVNGAFGKDQTATIPGGLKATGTERSFVTAGNGQMTKKDDTVDAFVSIYLQTGKKVDNEEVNITVGDQQLAPALRAGVGCVPVGSRVVVTAKASDILGSQGNAQLGVAGTDSLVIVTDVIKATSAPPKPALPKPADWKNPPTVTFGADGTPAVTLPGTTPDPNYELHVLQAGSGDIVQSGDNVTVDYQGTSWEDGKIFDQSYGRQPASFTTDGVVPGFGGALVGQKVGTKLVVTIPPALGYGTASDSASSGNQLAGKTLVFVIDIKNTAR